MKNLFYGNLVRLSDESPEILANSQVKWDRDTEQHRLAHDGPAQLWSAKKIKEYFEKHSENTPQSFGFCIRTLADDSLIGGVSLWVVSWSHADAWMGISIGDRDYWGRGYGTDAIQLILQYGFLELNLRRVSLGLHAYNERALRSYEKAGFILEGRVRGEILREGQRYDGIYMGILYEEWLGLQKK